MLRIEKKEPAGSGLWFYAQQFAFNFVMIHYFLWIFVMLAFLWVMYCVHWAAAALCLAYYLKTFTDGSHIRTGRPWVSFRDHPIWDLATSWSQLTSIREQPLDPQKKYVFGIHPHGILILSRVGAYGGLWPTMFPGLDYRVLGATPMFLLPGARDLCLWMGAVDAGKRTADNCLKKGISLMIYPGGSEEIFETDPDSETTTLISRKGFVRLAFQHGASVVPVFVFGEKWMYKRLHISEKVRKFFLRVFKIPLIVFWGRYFTWLRFSDQLSKQPNSQTFNNKKKHHTIEPTPPQTHCSLQKAHGNGLGSSDRHRADRESDFRTNRGRSCSICRRNGAYFPPV
eukprot:TRINITY_DN3840_c0_g1_i4.p1 TRINITY_DN3840_c0_g1~~TRINITY_DN3840_c0_g1_i4.p1  ORF type:complete len:341 (+),score=45.75 TRINITY_DN3840_c0_g1_i4:712-1734(+)